MMLGDNYKNIFQSVYVANTTKYSQIRFHKNSTYNIFTTTINLER